MQAILGGQPPRGVPGRACVVGDEGQGKGVGDAIWHQPGGIKRASLACIAIGLRVS